ncbi:MCE family protein [Nocardia nova]|uniref:MlaD family protein n=1 Tax=Nocardia nova TaxID=37330 RepID=UPI0025B0F3C5|nr:MlaD family protein [Nocardia nova]MDN2495457.1 MCE family protein [Nocardia nova]
MNTRTWFSLAGMACITVASFGYMSTLGMQVPVLEHNRTASMQIPETNGLVVGSKVLLRGVPIGHVTAVSSSADHIDVQWNYNRDFEIPLASSFRIDNLSALGETYIAVVPTSEAGPYLADHATIAAADITVPTTIEELSARLTRLLEQVDPEQIGELFHTLDVALPTDPQVLQNLNNAGSLLAQTLIERSGNLTRLLSTMQPLLQDSAWVGPGLAGTSVDAAGFGRGLQGFLNAARHVVDIGPLPEGISQGTGPFIDQLQHFLDKTAGDLNTLAVDVSPAVRAGAASMRTVDVGRLLDNALISTAAGDSVTVHVGLHGN